MKLRTVAMTGVMSLAGLGLVGAGAHAVFTAATTSAQTITAGTLSLVLQATNPDGSEVTGYNTNSITFAPFTAPVASAFVTAPQLITIYNNGSVTATEISMKLTDPYSVANAASANARQPDVGVHVQRQRTRLQRAHDHGGRVRLGRHRGSNHRTPGNRQLTRSCSTQARQMSGCGPTFTGISGDTYTSFEAYTPPNPALGTNPDPLALPLTSAAEGGTITPTFTVSYSG
jgi:predicted ribosomally synthesized peptide with SipW-like signal peptide